MSIIKDKRKNKIIYVDKENNHVAKENNILKLINIGNMSNVDIYINLISAGYYLNITETTVLKYIINHKGAVLITEICKEVAKYINKSTITVARAINSLKDKKLVYTTFNSVELSSAVAIDANTLAKTQFVVIEVNPEITSNGV